MSRPSSGVDLFFSSMVDAIDDDRSSHPKETDKLQPLSALGCCDWQHYRLYALLGDKSLPFQHCGLLPHWATPFGWRFLDVPFVQLLGLSCDTRTLPHSRSVLLQF